MASSNGLIESMCIHGTNSDHQRILEDLKKFETTISHLKCCRPKELSAEIKTKIHLLATSFQALQSRLFRNAACSKTLEKVWEESDVMLKYLFEKCIQYFEEDDRLKCVTCDEWLPVCRVVLKNHLQCSKHIRLFLKSVHHDLVSYWEDIEPQGGESEKDNHIDDDKCLMLKYGRFIDFDGPNNMLFCKLCCIVLPKNKSSLQAHFKDNLHQEMFKNVVEVIVGNVDVRDAEKMNAVSKSFETKHDRKIEDNYNTDASNSIAIPIGLSGIPENTTNDDLKRVIQHFGSINRIERIHPSFANAFIELREEFQSILCLGLTVTVSGKVVTITDPILPSETDDGANEISIHESVNSQSILMKFRTSSDLWVLIINLIMRSKKVCNYAESIALNLSTDLFSQNAIIPHCFYSVKAVGSKALFLAIDISSTLDLCIEEIYDEYHGKSKINAVELSTRTIKLFDILKKSKHFKNVEIVGDKMQVLKLLHKVTNTKCQIFYKDALIVEKTVLSKIYLDCDPNLRCTVLAVIEWFNGIGLKSVLSTYSILWLALLPLILCNDLHPVSTLRNLHDKTAKNAKKIISGWDCRFSRTFNPKMRQFPNVHEILQKIFKFYSNPCNFDKKVLAPLTGEKFEHQAILENKLPSPYSRYCYLISTKSVKFFKLTNGICLQDPLQLNFNLTESLQGNNLNKFVAHCTDALKYFDDTTYRMTKNESFEHVFKMDPFST